MRFLLLPALLVPGLVMAEDPVAAELVSDPFVESYQPEVSVSGNVIVGVMTLAATQAILDDEISVNAIAADLPKQLCLKAASRDGIYTSKNVYQLPAAVTGAVRLPYRSKLADVVDDYASDEIALAATAGDCDSGSSDYYLLSSATSQADLDVVIYLNSFGATDVFYQVDADIEACDYISEGRRTTYDFICKMSPPASDEGVPVTIIRERFGREQPSVQLRIIGVSQ